MPIPPSPRIPGTLYYGLNTLWPPTIYTHAVHFVWMWVCAGEYDISRWGRAHMVIDV